MLIPPDIHIVWSQVLEEFLRKNNRSSVEDLLIYSNEHGELRNSEEPTRLHKKLLGPFLVIIAGLSGLLLLPTGPAPVNAASGLVGVVCLSNVTTFCPAPYSFTGTIGSKFTVRVVLQNSSQASGYDILVKADPTLAIINATSIDTTGSILPPTFIGSECINGVAITGVCRPQAQANGVVEVGVISSLTFSIPTTGLLFSITYTVKGTTPSASSIPITFQTGCTGTSVSPDTCVTVTGQAGSNAPETVQAGFFTNSAPGANFVASPSTGFMPLTVKFDASQSFPGPLGASITSYNWVFGDGSPAAMLTSSTTTHVYSQNGTYIASLIVHDTSLTSIQNNMTITVKPPEFKIDASPNPTAVLVSRNRNVTIILTSTGGNSTVSLQAVVSNSSLANRPTTTFNVTNVRLSPSGTNSSRLTIMTMSNTPSGHYTVRVTGTISFFGHSISHTVVIILTVVTPDFTIVANPNSARVKPGTPVTSFITVTALNFTGTVSLQATVSNTTIADRPTTKLKLSSLFVNSTSSSSTTNSTTVTLYTTTSTPGGNYTITVTGTSGKLAHNANFTLTVTGFNIAAFPPSLTLALGAPAASTIRLSSVNVTGTVTLSTQASIGLNAKLGSNSLSLPANGTAVTTLSLSATVAGTYNVNVTATLGNVSHNTTVTINFTSGPDFFIIANPASVGPLNPGVQGTSTITVTSLNRYNATLTLTNTVSPTATALSVICAPLSLKINATSKTATSNCTFSTTTPNIYTVTFTATNITTVLFHSTTVTVTVADFTLAPSGNMITPCNAGFFCDINITVTGSNGFAGTVTLTVPQVAGLTATLSPNTVTGSGISTMTVVAVNPGAYFITVTATSGSLQHTTGIITINVVDFTVTSGLSSWTLSQGSTATSTISLALLGPLVGKTSITLSTSGVPVGTTASFARPILTLSQGGKNTTTLTISIGTSTPGIYRIIVNGTKDAELFQTTTIILTVVLPTIKVVSTSLSTTTVTLGQRVTLTVQVLNNGTSTLQFNVTMDVNGQTVAAQRVTLTPSQTPTTVTLTWDTTGYNTGPYNVKVRFVGATTTGGTPVPVDLSSYGASPGSITVNSPPPTGIPGGIVLWIGIGAVAAALVLAFLLLRRRKRPIA